MSSDQEEGTDHPDESNANSSATEANQSFEKKDNGLNEHAKPRRRRRGKKRKHKKESAATCEAENHDECESELHAEDEHNHADCETPSWDSDENLSCDINTFSDIIIRPINVPKAPENSTQFIMDDHNDCHFYYSFETPNPYLADPPHLDGEDGDIVEPVGEDAAYRDIDYQYESPQDFDNSAYYDREFELSYKNNRFDELMRLSRTELISSMTELETRLKELSDELVKENPSPILEKLQAELLELQEKHTYLKECNSKLTAVLLQTETDCSENIAPETLPDISSPLPEDHGSHAEDSDSGEVYHETSSQPADEVAMADISVDIDTTDAVCDKDSSDSEIDSNITGDLPLSEQMKTLECSVNTTKISSDSEEEQPKLNSNSHVVHCHSDIRTLGIGNSDMFHIAKCSSSVPLEGGMSPSETSVN